MLIINADDYGLDELNTMNILNALQSGAITSTTAMVYAAYSEQAAEKAIDRGLGNIGLHLNFSYAFNSPSVGSKLKEHQNRIIGYLRKNKFSKYIYNPGLKDSLDYCYHNQRDEFCRLYGREPTHVDGHEYYHLCVNFLFSGLLPTGSKMRPSINTYNKGWCRQTYKKTFNYLLSMKYNCVDRLYDVDANKLQCLDLVNRAVKESRSKNVELMVHIESEEEIRLIHNNDFRRMIENANLGSYADL